MPMKCVVYSSQYKDVWNDTVHRSRNATFLHIRDYMDYHADRFVDASLLFFNDKGKCIACLPATFQEETGTISSHAGLTYGGLLLTPEATSEAVRQILILTAGHLLSIGYNRLIYKPVPHIYHSIPAEEDLYWLFRAGAEINARSVSTTISLLHPLPLSTLRRRKVAQANKIPFVADLNATANFAEWQSFWDILHEVLVTRHNTVPVHSYEEIMKLREKFPQEIRLFTVKDNYSQVVGGCVVFETETTAHVQYIAANELGRNGGALDLLFSELIAYYCKRGKTYFDFGISTEQGGRFLNEGLIFQKEGFGGRAVCYDIYEVDLKKLQAIGEQ